MDNIIDNLELATNVDEVNPDKIELSKIEFPEHIINIQEVAVIQSLVDDLLAKVTTAINNLNADLHIATATEEGIARREKIYGIKPSDTATLEERRFALRLRAADSREYTEKYLRQQLDNLVGADNYRMTINYEELSMRLLLSLGSKSKEAEVKKLLSAVVPLHINLTFSLLYNTWEQVTNGKTWDELKPKTWNDWKENPL